MKTGKKLKFEKEEPKTMHDTREVVSSTQVTVVITRLRSKNKNENDSIAFDVDCAFCGDDELNFLSKNVGMWIYDVLKRIDPTTTMDKEDYISAIDATGEEQ